MTATRTKWPAARHIQEAADQLRAVAADIPAPLNAYADPVADWLDQAANDMAWLAPYRDHEGGWLPWQAATRIAHGVLGLSSPDTCPACHPARRPTQETP